MPLSPGSTTWNEEQSRQNFELVQRVVVPGYVESPLIRHPLAEEAGGDPRSRRRPAIRLAERPGLADIEGICAGSEAEVAAVTTGLLMNGLVS